MATYFARKSGNINATDVWATTPTGTAAAQTFAAGDVLVANSFTITLNVDTNLGSTGEVRNDTTGGATAGGSFSLSNGVTLTANVTAGAVTCVTLAGSASATIVGNINAGTASAASGVSFTSTGSLAITGSITGGSASTAVGVSQNSGGTVTITGNVTGGSVNTARGVSANYFGLVTITGTVTAGSAGEGVYINAGSVTIAGTVSGGSGNGQGLNYAGTGTATITGTAVGAASAGISHTSAGTLTVTRAKGGPTASSAVGVVGSTIGSTSVEEIEFGDLGASPTSGPIRLTDKTSNVAVMYRAGLGKKTLTDPNATGLMPAASNVRSGVVYNGGNNTGTCIIPPTSSVVSGAPVDATTGTAALTPASLWDYLTSAATTSGSMGERLSNCATVASVGQSLANALTP